MKFLDLHDGLKEMLLNIPLGEYFVERRKYGLCVGSNEKIFDKAAVIFNAQWDLSWKLNHEIKGV